jgi:hypothetical protein
MENIGQTLTDCIAGSTCVWAESESRFEQHQEGAVQWLGLRSWGNRRAFAIWSLFVHNLEPITSNALLNGLTNWLFSTLWGPDRAFEISPPLRAFKVSSLWCFISFIFHCLAFFVAHKLLLNPNVSTFVWLSDYISIFLDETTTFVCRFVEIAVPLFTYLSNTIVTYMC